jgi:protease IV
MSKQDTVSDVAVASSRQRRRRVWYWIFGVVAALTVVWSAALCVLVGVSSGRSGGTVAWGGDAIAVIYVEGTIGMSSPTTGTGVNSDEVIGYIERAEGNRRIKAIVVYISSPGGTVVPSDEMYQALRAAEKPVVVAMGDIAASGGYYIACGADKILAHPATITGSIGVYGQMINAADLLERLGVEGIIVRSGDSKAAGNWFEHPTKEQIAIEQAIVDDLNDMFVQAVIDGRGLAEEDVRQLADGRPYTGRRALELGLIDALGNLSDAISAAAELAGIEGEPQIIEYRRTSSWLDLWLAKRQSVGSEIDALRWLDAQSAIPQMRYRGP